MPRGDLLRVRSGTTDEWISAGDPVLADREVGYDETLDVFKVGDGTTAFTVLEAAGGGPAGVDGGPVGPQVHDAPAPAATVELNPLTGTDYVLSLTGDITLTPDDVDWEEGQGVSVDLLQDGTGGHEAAFAGGVNWRFVPNPIVQDTAADHYNQLVIVKRIWDSVTIYLVHHTGSGAQ